MPAPAGGAAGALAIPLPGWIRCCFARFRGTKCVRRAWGVADRSMGQAVSGWISLQLRGSY